MLNRYQNSFAIGAAALITVIVFALGRGDTTAAANAPAASAAARAAETSNWVAAAPGRVEPRTGDIKIAAAAPGRIAQVLVKAGDTVGIGEILIRLNDEDASARVRAADAEVNAKKKDRDATPLLRGGEDRRLAEDTAAGSERAYIAARDARDKLISEPRGGTAKDADIQKAIADLQAAKDKLAKDRDALSAFRNGTKASGGARSVDWALASARANLSLADADLERTRVRAVAPMTVLQVIGKPGEFVAATPEQPLVVLGDLSRLRVRAELDERDIGKLSIGQRAVAKADAFRDREFEGEVVSLAPALGPPRIGPRGPRKPTDVDVLEVLIDLAPGTPLLPNMRVDVYFRPLATTQAGSKTEATK